MGKRTLRTLHYELVASQIAAERERAHEYAAGQYREGALVAMRRLAWAFADEFEIRGQTFDRAKFLRSCGLEGE